MRDPHFVAIDIGVSFIKVGIYDLGAARKALALRRAPASQPSPGLFSQDPDTLYDLVRDALREAVRESGVGAGSFAAIAVSGAMGGALGVDAAWRPTTDWSIVTDTRFMGHATAMQSVAHEQILGLSGTNLPVMGAKILWWRDSAPEAYARTAKYVVIAGYVAAKLGEAPIGDAFIDRTYLNFTGIADIGGGVWSAEICNRFNIDMTRLPRIVSPDAIVGRLSISVAVECGLREGIPIAAGAGDKPVGTLGAGLVTPGLLVDESASFGALSLCIDRYVPDAAHKTLENLPSPVDGLYLPSVFLNGSGLTHQWFVDTFGAGDGRSAPREGENAFDALARAAANVPPGSEGLMAIGLLGGRSYPNDPSIRGLWIGHTLFHRREHFYRALLESIAYEYASILAVMRENYPEVSFHEIRVIGGGARSGLWNQIKADVMGVRYVRLDRDDYAMLGDVLLAAGAVGLLPSPAEAAPTFSRPTRSWEPDLEKTAYYARHLALYRELFDHERILFEALQHIPPWGENTNT